MLASDGPLEDEQTRNNLNVTVAVSDSEKPEQDNELENNCDSDKNKLEGLKLLFRVKSKFTESLTVTVTVAP